MSRDEFPLRFVPPGIDLGDWPAVEGQFRRLEETPLNDARAAEGWLEDWSELESALSEEEQNRYVAMTCQTDDAQRERRYLDFVEQVQPGLKRRRDRLDRKLLESAVSAALPRARYEVLLRQIRNRVELFRDENVPLQTEDEKLRAQYQKICGAMSVQFDGREQTLQQMARYLEETDRPRRQTAWEAVAGRRYADRDAIDEVFDAMVALRDRMARNAGLPDYRAYAFRALERFDYTPADCERFHDAVECHVVPLVREIQEQRRKAMGLEALRPWDLAVDPLGRSPLRPFATDAELVGKCARVFERVSPDFAQQFDHMRRERLLDLGSRKGKAPGGYMTVFERRRLPFIFMNAVGRHDDVHTMLHEGGHAFHAFAVRGERLLSYRNPPIEFAEVASMGMELLCEEHLSEFYAVEEHRRALREDLEDVLGTLCWIATIDAFQHWIYANPAHTRAERTAAWLGILKRFGGIEDWSGFEPYRSVLWHRQLHPFTVPFYYIEYGIAQLGALQVWRNARQDYRKAVADYRAGLALGGSRPLPELFNAAGAKLDFSERVIQPLTDLIRSDLEGAGIV
ncbi:MAG: M3 family oligoendopeptidase [Phycisphaerae bacterium]|nr:M3 family oligoendopeptidase [Phycisphaerae bacterium]NUQ46512.1 M3 family oligoendopeptidase [Phycisphaerae bacterium]